jgi:hypothetical protein
VKARVPAAAAVVAAAACVCPAALARVSTGTRHVDQARRHRRMQVYVTLLVQWAAYWAAAVYLGNVLPDEVGRRRPWFYWALPAYWRPRATDAAAALQHVMQQEAQVRRVFWGGHASARPQRRCIAAPAPGGHALPLPCCFSYPGPGAAAASAGRAH